MGYRLRSARVHTLGYIPIYLQLAGAQVSRIPWRACSVRCRWLFPNGLPLTIMDRRGR